MAKNFAIDGGVATGGSTLAQRVATAFEFEKIPTSQTYRGLSVLARDERIPIADATEQMIIDFMREQRGRLVLTSSGIEIDGVNRSEEAGLEVHGDGASIVSAIQAVRDEFANPAVLACTANSRIHTVSEGRNEYRLFKNSGMLLAGVYLHASVESRIDRFRAEAARRLNRHPDAITDQEIAVLIVRRDLDDMSRTVEPLLPHEHALKCSDTTSEGISQLVDAVKNGLQIMIDTGPEAMSANNLFSIARIVIEVALKHRT